MSTLQPFNNDHLSGVEQVQRGIDYLWRPALQKERFLDIQHIGGAPVPDRHLHEMLFYSRLQSFYNSGLYAIETRRAFIKGFCELNGWQRKMLDVGVGLPSYSFVKYIMNISKILYSLGVKRSVTKETENGTEKDEELTKGFNDYLNAANIQSIGAHAYRQAKYYGVHALRPAWDEVKEQVRYALRSPAEFRVKLDVNDNVTKYLEATTYIREDGVEVDAIAVWTDTEYYLLVNGEKVLTGKNTYGKIPVVFLRSDQANFWGDPMNDLADSCIMWNYYELLQSEDATGAATLQWVAVNLGIGDDDKSSQKRSEQTAVMSPRSVWSAKAMDSDGIAPTLTAVSGTSHITELQQKQASIKSEAFTEYGVPPVFFSEEAKDVSGVALMQLMKPVLDERAEDAAVWDGMDREICAMTAMILNAHAGTNFPEEVDRYDIEFLEPSFSTGDPMAELDYWKALAKAGLVSPQQYALQWGLDVKNDDEAREAIKTNRALLRGIETDGMSATFANNAEGPQAAQGEEVLNAIENNQERQ